MTAKKIQVYLSASTRSKLSAICDNFNLTARDAIAQIIDGVYDRLVSEANSDDQGSDSERNTDTQEPFSVQGLEAAVAADEQAQAGDQ